MSSVTSVIIIQNTMGEDRGKPLGKRFIDRLNAYFADPSDDNPQYDKHPFCDIEPCTGGTKGMWGKIYAKGCNYLDLEHFLDWLVNQKWNYPEQTQILIHREWANDQVYYGKTIRDLMLDKYWKEMGWCKHPKIILWEQTNHQHKAGSKVCAICHKGIVDDNLVSVAWSPLI